MIKHDQDYSQYLPKPHTSRMHRKNLGRHPTAFEALPPSVSSSYQPEEPEVRAVSPEVNKKKYLAGTWSAWENYVYLRFMGDNHNQFLTERERRRCKVFFRLAKILKKRTPDQCRSHHQKLQIKFKDNLKTIMGEVHRKIQKQVAEDYVASHCLFPQLPNFMNSQAGFVEKKRPEFKMLREDSWFKVEKGNEGIKLTIWTDNIQKW